MDILINTAQLWWNLPTFAKVLILPQPILLPIQCGGVIYKGYKWLYPPNEKIKYVLFEIEQDDEDKECIIIT